jgi:hypothetical protein
MLKDDGVMPKPQIREVVFGDSADFRLYNNSFHPTKAHCLQRFAAGEPEIVFKFPHPDMQKAAELDMRPNIAGNYGSSSRQKLYR